MPTVGFLSSYSGPLVHYPHLAPNIWVTLSTVHIHVISDFASDLTEKIPLKSEHLFHHSPSESSLKLSVSMLLV